MRRFINFIIALILATGFVVTGCGQTSTALTGPLDGGDSTSVPVPVVNHRYDAAISIRLKHTFASPMASDSVSDSTAGGTYSGIVTETCPSGHPCLTLISFHSTDTVTDGYISDSSKSILPGAALHYLIGSNPIFNYVYGKMSPDSLRYTHRDVVVLDTAATAYCAQADSAGQIDIANYCIRNCPTAVMNGVVGYADNCYVSSRSFVVAAENKLVNTIATN